MILDSVFHLHLEISSKCALKCLRCPRTENPLTPWLNRELSTEFIFKNLNPKIIMQLKRITFCGDVGDAIYHSNLIEIVKYIKDVNPQIHLYIITNGSYRSVDWWEKLALNLNDRDTVAFSLDGLDQETNSKYRVNSDWKSIEDGFRTLRKNSNVFLTWAFIYFKFNQHLVSQVTQRAKAEGFDYLQTTKSTKFGNTYGVYLDENSVDNLQPDSNFISKSLRFEREVLNLSGRQIDNESFLKSMKENSLETKKSSSGNYVFPLCKTGNRGLYINCEKRLYPCSWVSYPFKRKWTFDQAREMSYENSFFYINRDRFDLEKHTLDEILSSNVWGDLEASFKSKESCDVECINKCRAELMNESYEVGWFLN